MENFSAWKVSDEKIWKTRERKVYNPQVILLNEISDKRQQQP